MPNPTLNKEKKHIPAARKAIIYLGMLITTAGTVVFFSGFVVFASGFVEFIKPDDIPSIGSLSDPSQDFDKFRRKSDERWRQIEKASQRKQQIFSDTVSAVLPRWLGGLALVAIGNGITGVGKKGIAGLAEEDSKVANQGFYVETYYNAGDIMSQAPKYNYNLQNAQFGGGLINAETVNAQEISGNITHNTQQQNLVQAAAEIQQLLKQLEATNPTTTEIEKLTLVAKAAEEIKQNPNLKARVMGAIKAGGTEAFKEAVDHPLVNILVATIQGWQITK
jgi:hypothetical protein